MTGAVQRQDDPPQDFVIVDAVSEVCKVGGEPPRSVRGGSGMEVIWLKRELEVVVFC